MTKCDKGDPRVIDIEACSKCCSRPDLHRLLAEGLSAAAQKRVVPAEEAFARVKREVFVCK